VATFDSVFRGDSRTQTGRRQRREKLYLAGRDPRLIKTVGESACRLARGRKRERKGEKTGEGR